MIYLFYIESFKLSVKTASIAGKILKLRIVLWAWVSAAGLFQYV